ncbi:DNA polymerase ligase-domain-containing protein [Hyaloraphidium curvatum]|nr:DNA polymerase ligase-domain-containing protein [Hyaloraphidium curvatum]
MATSSGSRSPSPDSPAPPPRAAGSALPPPPLSSPHPHVSRAELDALLECGRMFVVQRHDAKQAGLHYDLRLEHGGVLKSWAVKKGFSDDPGVKRLAVETNDHAKNYATFEGHIPPDCYGAGSVQCYDIGWFEVVDKAAESRRAHGSGSDSDADGPSSADAPGTYNRARHSRMFAEQWATKKLSIVFHGRRLRGRWSLFRFEAPPRWKTASYGGKVKSDPRSAEGSGWFVKRKSGHGTGKRGEDAELCERPWTARSALTGRTVEEIIAEEGKNWERVRMSDIFAAPGVDGGRPTKGEAGMFGATGGADAAAGEASGPAGQPADGGSHWEKAGPGFVLGAGPTSPPAWKRTAPSPKGSLVSASALMLLKNKRRGKRDYDTDESEEERELERQRRAAKQAKKR